jgi:hypothetical protein
MIGYRGAAQHRMLAAHKLQKGSRCRQIPARSVGYSFAGMSRYRSLVMKFSLLILAAVVIAAGCGKSPARTGGSRTSGYIEEQPHVNTGTGGIGSGPTGTGGSEPADQSPMSR